MDSSKFKFIFDKMKISIKQLIVVFCVIGFLYQTTDLILSYNSNNTVVNLEIGRIRGETLPAITICNSEPALNKLATINQYFKNHYNDYLKLLEQNNGSEVIKHKLISLYSEIQYSVLFLINNHTLDSYDLLKNYTSSFEKNIIITTDFAISDNINMTENELDRIFKEQSYNPLISAKTRFGFTKCFTFFSYLDNIWKSTKFDYFSILVRLVSNNSINYFTHETRIRFSIHSANTIPDTLSFKTIYPGKTYDLSFSSIKIKRLSDLYNTHCKEYGDGQYEMRSDCIFDCYQKIMNQQCNTNNLVASMSLVRDEYLLKNRNQTPDEPCIKNEAKIEKIKIICMKSCHQECTYQYYLFQLERMNNIDLNGLFILVDITHNKLPDITIIQLREMDLTTFVCNFGGLIGMWLGLSFINIIETIIFKMISLKRARLIFNNFNQRNIFVINRSIQGESGISNFN